jgi:3'(2'), 5'-bisphosphate nucleotidase
MTTSTCLGPTISSDQALRLLDDLTALAIDAGRAILAIDRSGLAVQGKADGSPVTQADLAADRVIAAGLAALCPAIPVVSEERAPEHTLLSGSFFLIDPLDGTKEFIAGRDEFTVNVALVVDGTPLLGIIGAPAKGVLWRGVVGHGAERLTLDISGSIIDRAAIHTRSLPASGQPWVAAVSRSHGNARTEAFIDARPGAERRTLGSAVKLGRIAEGSADIYPRLGPTSEWDIAAGHALVTAAGGVVTDCSGAPIRYGIGHPQFLVPEFIAWGDPEAAAAQAG